MNCNNRYFDMAISIKRYLKRIVDNAKLLPEFLNDFEEYRKYNYHGKYNKSLSAYEAMLYRHSHILEKGMSLEMPRKGFGCEKVEELLSILAEYEKKEYSKSNYAYQHALNVLDYYIQFQINLGYINEDLFTKTRLVLKDKQDDDCNIIGRENIETLKKSIHSEYSVFFNSRHSVRQFSDKEIAMEDIEKAVCLAQKAPTACNRQATKVYIYEDQIINKRIGDHIWGNNGFRDKPNKYLVITCNISSFYDTFERNQLYVEAGFFSMALVEALHYYGVASCVLQNGEYKSRNIRLKEICGNIPNNEKIVLFIAIGYYKNEFTYAESSRRGTEEVLIKG